MPCGGMAKMLLLTWIIHATNMTPLLFSNSGVAHSTPPGNNVLALGLPCHEQ
jgi:hypothetical protein